MFHPFTCFPYFSRFPLIAPTYFDVFPHFFMEYLQLHLVFLFRFIPSLPIIEQIIPINFSFCIFSSRLAEFSSITHPIFFMWFLRFLILLSKHISQSIQKKTPISLFKLLIFSQFPSYLAIFLALFPFFLFFPLFYTIHVSPSPSHASHTTSTGLLAAAH